MLRLNMTLPGLRLNMTLPGLGGPKAPPPPPPPAAPPAPPTQVQASQAVAGRQRGRMSTDTQENVRNMGGARGLATGSIARALKSLTGQ